MRLADPTLKNIGPGPAFNVKIESLKGDDVEMECESIPLIEVGETTALTFYVRQGGTRNGMSSWTALLANLIIRKAFPQTMMLNVYCEGLTRKQYRTLHQIRYEAAGKRVETAFRGITEI